MRGDDRARRGELDEADELRFGPRRQDGRWRSGWLLTASGAVLVEGLRLVYDTDRDTLLAQVKLIVSTPALRERQWAGQLATQQVILQALQSDQLDPDASFQARVTVAACLAAASTAVLTWVENDGTPELPDLIDQAFDALTRPGSGAARPGSAGGADGIARQG